MSILFQICIIKQNNRLQERKGKNMKKVVSLLVASILLLPNFTSANSEVKNVSLDDETTEYPTVEEIEKMNEALDKIVVEANKKLENGETEFVIEEKIGDETIELGFESRDVIPTFGSNAKTSLTSVQTYTAAAASGRKLYRANVKNTAGWDFEHIVAGEFTYGSGKIKGATMDVKQTGTMYSESHKTWIDKLDPSVWAVQSHGTFKALKYTVEYNTYLTVKILGSGSYRVERASITF